MTVDVGDNDRGEIVDHVDIRLPGNPHGTFFYNGVALTVSGNTVTVPGGAFSPTDATNQFWTLSGVTFVPDADYSAYNADRDLR